MASCLCWSVEAHFFSHLLLDRKKDEYLCSFLEAVPRLVIRHSLQPVCFSFCWGLLLLLLVLFFFFLLKRDFKIASLRTWFRVDVSNQNFTHDFLVNFIFFQAIATDTYNVLPYLHSSAWLAQFRNVMRLRYEGLPQWQQNRSIATMWQLYKFQDSDHFMDESLGKCNPVWIKNLCVIQNCIITELNRQQVKGHLPVFPQKYQSIIHWICPCCFAKITAALFI